MDHIFISLSLPKKTKSYSVFNVCVCACVCLCKYKKKIAALVLTIKPYNKSLVIRQPVLIDPPVLSKTREKNRKETEKAIVNVYPFFLQDFEITLWPDSYYKNTS